MLDYGTIPLAETENATNLQGFFISPIVAQPNTFGVKAPVFTLAQRGNPACCFSVSATKSGVEAGVFSFLGSKVKGYFTVSEQWKSKVYHQWEVNRHWTIDGKATPYWQEIREAVLKSDNHTCQRCGVYGRDLTVHHILPRAEGGGDNPENLIALCAKCHDEVELAGYRSRWHIMNYFEDENPNEDNRHITNDWRGWVYGAGRRPKKR